MKAVKKESNQLGLFIIIIVALVIIGDYLNRIVEIYATSIEFLGTYASTEPQDKDMRMVVFPEEDNYVITFYNFDPMNYSSESGTYQKIDSNTYLVTFEELGEQTIVHDNKRFQFTINGEEITFVKTTETRIIVTY